IIGNALNDYRIRRVKCDEQKPQCKNCTSTGRKCEGYSRSNLATSEHSQVQGTCRRHKSEACSGILSDTLLATSSLLGPWERRSFDYLRSEAVPEIFGVFDSDFWTPMLQRRVTEPVLQHALSSLSAVYGHYRRDSQLNHFAIQQYNKAIQLLRRNAPMTQIAFTLR
ncbi:uncharacterized protein A1O9_12743, partial [Exophiala aquamarina CBS 119918]